MTATRHLLRADGFEAVFVLEDADGGCVDLVVEFRLDPQLGDVAATSVPTSVRTSDLDRLVAYLEGHVRRLVREPDTVAHPFVTHELGFHLQAHEGSADASGDGEFAVTVMVQVGRTRGSAVRTYVGGESQVAVGAVRDFTRSLRAASPGPAPRDGARPTPRRPRT